MKKLIVANWKMNPLSEKEAIRLAKACDLPRVTIAPPFVFLAALKKILKKARLGAQDAFFEKQGPYTGEISFGELNDFGVKDVIIGHSERRALGETDVLINKKIKALLETHFRVILCVGEPFSVRKKGLNAAKKFVAKQLLADLRGMKKFDNLTVAYEPIWAIGSGKNDDPKEAAQMADAIKSLIKTPVLYGGSVNAKNIRGFLRERSIDGALVGGASLKPAEFIKIVKAAAEY